MTKMKLVAAVAAIVAVAAIIGSVQAHQWSGPRHHGTMHKAGMHGDWGHRGGRGHHGGKWSCDMAKYIDGRLAFLKTELEITPEQEKLWEDYATVAKTNATSMQERCEAKKAKWKDAKEKGEGKERPPLPERLDARTQSLEAKLEALRAKTTALKPLYDALNDEQKKTADELIRG